ncbi:MAG: protoheme IX farnesyltransferase [Verrucomicrobiae bacterium]|nr:protoheme IX farnesyltransferase [Verrucomicrobiae bacterium]
MAEAGIDSATAETLTPVNVRVTPNGASVYDFFQLMKPRVMSLVILTAMTGMVLAPGTIHPVMAFIAILAISVGAGASGALNMWYDADIDAQMQRTTSRPIPRGKISPDDALAFGSFLSFASVLTLGLLVNVAAGALLALTIGFYLFVYTMWLKRRTAQNIVIGGAAGAFPPMIGWAAVTGGVSVESVLLFAIIFFWTPPHFWALALYRCRDYEKVGVPMLPVVAGPTETRRQIVLYSFLLVPLGMAPYALGMGSLAYLVASTVLGALFLRFAFDVRRITEGREADAAAKKLFAFSILYLFALFGLLLIEGIIRRVMA